MDDNCWIIGVTDGGPETLSPRAAELLGKANAVFGDQRFLDLYKPLLAARCRKKSISDHLPELPGWIQEALGEGRKVAVLASGDPLHHGLGSYLVRRLPPDTCRILGAPSTLQQACERLALPWETAHRMSVHQGDGGDWTPTSGPDHPLFPVLGALGRYDLITLLTSPVNSPERIARMMVQRGVVEGWEVAVAERLGSAGERISAWISPLETAARVFPAPNVMILRRRGIPAPRPPVLGVPDERFRKRSPLKGLITRREVRAVALARLELREGDILWDIGAGSGSVGLEAARLCSRGMVYAIERNAECLEMIRENRRELGVVNHILFHGEAPRGMEQWPDPDAIFLGGSGGRIEDLVGMAWERLKPGGRLVMNFAVLENLARARNRLQELNAPWEMIQVTVARSRPLGDLHRLGGEGPVWIVTAAKDRA
ncbi:MAG: precorrin-6y C5,15-methyltransferase (decarboxylating) subunit CbiE [Magnetococcales bacterium]|nr:precorrin-6y C5,15-methyltransferase (decarboxylating) subunit CbiE [Magnetococcales bacterium]